MSEVDTAKFQAKFTPDEALAWFGDFYEQNGHLPTKPEIRALSGPSAGLRQNLGGMFGIAQTLGVEPTKQVYTDHELRQTLSSWVLTQGIERAPTYPSAMEAYKAGALSVSPVVLAKRSNTWYGALAETGYFRFNWAASECVGFARRSTPRPKQSLQSAIEERAQAGVTPILKDIRGYYPSIGDLRNTRINWESWTQSGNFNTPRARAKAERRNTISILSHGVLALASVEGEMHDFEHANQMLFKEDRGPRFNRSLYAGIAPSHLSEDAGYIWTLDLIDTVHNNFVNREHSQGQPFVDLGIGLTSRPRNDQLIHPTFLPELAELKS